MAQPLRPIRLRELGQLGFWAESDEVDSPLFAATLSNAVFDEKGRVAARKGWSSYLASAITGTPEVCSLHYYAKEIGDTEFWIAAGDDNKLYKLAGAVGAGTATDITGAITSPSGCDWQFVNYNNLVVGMQQDDNPISWNGSGNFADYGSGTALPDGNCLLSAWGRLFGTTADGQQINWTATLGSDFDAVGSGQLNVRLVWPDGKDKIVAIRAFNKRLVIFGQRNILIYGDDAASQLDAGLDPNSTSFTLKETIEGVGLYARDAVAEVGNDLLFLTPNGVRSLRRAVDYEFHPMEGVTKSINPFLQTEIESSLPAANTCKMVYDQQHGMVLMRVGDVNYYLDVRRRYQDPNDPREEFYRAALWIGMDWKAAAVGDDRALRFGFAGGVIGEYGGYLDNTSTYTLDLSSAWLSLEQGQGEGERLKFLKRLFMLASTNQTYTVNIRWQWDFSQNQAQKAITVTQDAAPAEWGLGEWGEDEWAGGTSSGIYRGTTTGSGGGTYFRVGFSIAINGSAFAYNALSAQMKLGRLTR